MRFSGITRPAFCMTLFCGFESASWCIVNLTPRFWRAICVEHRTLVSPELCSSGITSPAFLYDVILPAEFLATTLPHLLGLIYPPTPPTPLLSPSRYVGKGYSLRTAVRCHSPGIIICEPFRLESGASN